MIKCQGSLLLLFAMFLAGAATIDVRFIGLAVSVVIISILLGYKKDDWE